MCKILSFSEHVEKIEAGKKQRALDRKNFFRDYNTANKMLTRCLYILQTDVLSDFEYAKIKKVYNENLANFTNLKKYGIEHGLLEADGNRLA